MKVVLSQVHCSALLAGLLTFGLTVPGFTHAVGNNYNAETVIGHEAAHGFYDPSVEYDDKGNGWLAYSSISMPRIHTRLARTSDKGETWTDVKAVNEIKMETLTIDGKQIEGLWRNEVPSLVYCPGDPGKEWKLFWHKYYVKPPFRPKDRVLSYGWIAYKYASDPAGEWSEEIALFGGKNYPSRPFTVQTRLSNLAPALKPIYVYTEPGTLCKDGVLYLSLEGSTNPRGIGSWNSRKTLLFASNDYAKSWEFLGTLTDSHDANHLHYTILTASSLFEENGRQYIMVTPAGSLFKSNKDPKGIYVFQFSDISKAQLKRDKNNQLKVKNYIEHSNDDGVSSGGHGDYDQQNKNGGVVMGQIMKSSLLGIFNRSRPEPFQIVFTGSNPLP